MSRHTVKEWWTKRAQTTWYSAVVIGSLVAGLVTPALAFLLAANDLPFALALLLPMTTYVGVLFWGRHRTGAWERSVGTVLFVVAVIAGASVLPSWVMQQKHTAISAPSLEANLR